MFAPSSRSIVDPLCSVALCAVTLMPFTSFSMQSITMLSLSDTFFTISSTSTVQPLAFTSFRNGR